MTGPQVAWLPDGRLHLNHGPIDLIVEAWGAPGEVAAAYRQAVARFDGLLEELVAELPALRRPTVVAGNTPTPTPPLKGEGAANVAEYPSPLRGGVRGGGTPGSPRCTPFVSPAARRMHAAVSRLAHHAFITPMAAVAGAVADEVLAAMMNGRTLAKAYVNNGGDIALHVGPGESLRVAVVGTGHGFDDRFAVTHDSAVRGIATSGWRGRSFSLGIADAVTVLARTGAEADAAATMIANAVDLPGHEAVGRRPARELAPDSDLGDRMVTVSVGVLTEREIGQALERGLAVAEDFQQFGLIAAAALFLGGEAKLVGAPLVTLAPYVAPLCPAGHLPHEGGDYADRRCRLISPRVGEMSGRTEGGAKDRHPTRIAAEEISHA